MILTMNLGHQNTYQKNFHGKLNRVPIERNSDTFVDSQSNNSSQKQQDAGRISFRESYTVINYVLKENKITKAQKGM